jgi:hypothetical protein
MWPRKKYWWETGGTPYPGEPTRIPDPNARFRSIDNTMRDPTWGVESTFPAKIPQTSMAKKKGLSLENFVSAMSELKAPTGMDFGKGSRNVGGSRPSGGDPLTGLSATYPYTGVTKPSNEAIERLRKWGY